jgi:hypothetical protein
MRDKNKEYIPVPKISNFAIPETKEICKIKEWLRTKT